MAYPILLAFIHQSMELYLDTSSRNTENYSIQPCSLVWAMYVIYDA